MTLMGSFLIAALTVVGQADAPTNPSLKPLQQFVGNWQVRFTFKDGAVDNRVTYKWVMGGRFLEATFSDMSGKRVGTEMFGWDAADMAVKMWGFDMDSTYQGAWTFEGNVARYEGTSILTSGEREKGTVAITFASDTITAVGTMGDEKPRAFEGKFTRVNDATAERSGVQNTQTSSREDFEKYCQLIQGRWFNEDEKLQTLWPGFGTSDTKMVSHTDINITADGNALSEVWYGGTGMSSGMTIWDPATKQIRDFAAVSDGSFWEGVRSKQGNDWLCTETITHPDGTRQTLTSVLTFSADGSLHTYSDTTGGGTPAVYKRVGK